MRHNRFLTAAFGVLMSASFLGTAIAEAQETGQGKVYYKKGTRFEFEDFTLKFNMQLQPSYTYTDVDRGNRTDAGIESSSEDSSSFDMRRARAVFSGKMLDNQFAYKLQNDFASDSGGGDLKDAWLQWNSDYAKIRFGQFKQPHGREIRVSSTKLFFIERSVVTDAFATERAQGVMAHIPFGQGNFYVALNNGESTGEGRNRDGDDNRVRAHWAVDFKNDEYGSRGSEGDLRDDKDAFGYTVGANVAFGQGEVAGVSDFDKTDINIDAGLRVAGFDVWGEWYWSETDFDAAASGSGKPEDNGFILAASYVDPSNTYGAGFRFGYIEPDSEISDLTAVDNVQEYTFVVDYFINGHYLKLQNGVTFTVFDLEGGAGASSVDDFAYDLRLAGYF